MQKNIKGFVNRLSHDCHIDKDPDVSTAYCKSSSGDRVDLLSRTIFTTMVVSGGLPSKPFIHITHDEQYPSLIIKNL